MDWSKHSVIYGTVRFIAVYTTVPYVQVQRKKNRNTLIFYGKKMINPCPTPKLEYRHLSIVYDPLFNIFPVTAHMWWPSHPPEPQHGPYSDDRNP